MIIINSINDDNITLSFISIKIKIRDSQYRNKNFKMKDLKMGTIHHEI